VAANVLRIYLRLTYSLSHIQLNCECRMLYGTLVLIMDMLRHLINCRFIIIICIIIMVGWSLLCLKEEWHCG